MDRRTFLSGALALAAGVVGAGCTHRGPSVSSPQRPPFRAFTRHSEWNRPLPQEAPIDPASDEFISELVSFDPEHPWPLLVTSEWAEPIYWAREGDAEFEISGLPPVRIPASARPARTSDSQLTVYDVQRGLVCKLEGATFGDGIWSANGTSIYYLRSNGLEGTLSEADEPRNRGHRGFPPPIHAVRLDEIRRGSIEHVLKVAIRRTAARHVYPGAGDEGGPGLIPEGAILRIKPGVDLQARGISGAALTIARAMQTYGAVIGDRSGVPMALKLENLSIEGFTDDWPPLGISADSLSAIRFDDFDCVSLGYHRP
jgi:hypothetical protein